MNTYHENLKYNTIINRYLVTVVQDCTLGSRGLWSFLVGVPKLSLFYQKMKGFMEISVFCELIIWHNFRK